ncbi:MAG TPA: DUF3105 domain-containing protein [Thermomicrobiales bacterium]|jgi:hypothetical protein
MAQTKKPRPTTKVVSGKAQETAAVNERMTAAERRLQRAAEAKAMQQKKQRRNLLLIAGGVVVALLVLGYFGREAYINQGIGTPVANEGQGHVNVGETLTFNHLPPSSGKHYPTAQPPGIYRQEVQEGFWVHSLEHGYIVAAVKCTTDCDAIFNQLEEINKRLPESQFGNVKFVATPYSKPATDGDAKITLLAWGYEQKLDSVDKDITTRFYKKFVDKGPELVP